MATTTNGNTCISAADQQRASFVENLPPAGKATFMASGSTSPPPRGQQTVMDEETIKQARSLESNDSPSPTHRKKIAIAPEDDRSGASTGSTYTTLSANPEAFPSGISLLNIKECDIIAPFHLPPGNQSPDFMPSNIRSYTEAAKYPALPYQVRQRSGTAKNTGLPAPFYIVKLRHLNPDINHPKAIYHIITKFLPNAIHEYNLEIQWSKDGYNIKTSRPFYSVLVNSIGLAHFGTHAAAQNLAQQPRRNQPPSRPAPTLSVVAYGVDRSYTEDEVAAQLQQQGHQIFRVIRIRNAKGPTSLMRILSRDTATLDQLLRDGVLIYAKRHRVEASRSSPPQRRRCDRCQSYDHPTTAPCFLDQISYHTTENHLQSCRQWGSNPLSPEYWILAAL
ncbi:uncharacterized protein [Anabrus simplex]|uniref:uncharacterized protein n=1 Tax=Anabrus simplex TaxID=316456 RepID=UPI0035A2B4E3